MENVARHTQNKKREGGRERLKTIFFKDSFKG